MSRVPEVLDVWFDSGVSSWAALGYLGDKKKFQKYWPADLNIEGTDQIRGWWNSQLILSEIKFDKKPFENILVHGMVLDLGKRKMSKSLGNIVTPKDIINKYGRDYLRYYLAKISKGEDFAFDEKELLETEKVFRILININSFINQLDKKKAKPRIEDEWILSKFNTITDIVTESYNKFKFFDAIQTLEEFLVFDLSRNYIQVIRDRADETYDVLNSIRIGLLKLLSPVIPFVTESIWQELREKKIVEEESVCLSEWPAVKKSVINPNLESEFSIVSGIIEKGMAERDNLKIGLKWPLAKATITVTKAVEAAGLEMGKELQDIIARQLNVKKIEMKQGIETSVKFDTKMTPELEAEGYAREISRRVQSARKKACLQKTEKIELVIQCDESLIKMLSSQKKMLQDRTNSSTIKIASLKEAISYKNKSEEKIKDKRVVINFNKI